MAFGYWVNLSHVLDIGAERTDIWSFGAKPAQRTYAEIAKATAQFEPVTVGVSAGQYQNARYRLRRAC